MNLAQSISENVTIESKKKKKVRESKIVSNRVFEIDFLRGCVIVGMIIDHLIGSFHFLFNKIFNEVQYNSHQILADMSEFAHAYWADPIRHAIRFFGIALLFVITGISSHFSRNNFKRSLIIIAFGVAFFLFSVLLYAVSNKNFSISISGTLINLGFSIFLLWLTKWLYLKIERRIRDKKRKKDNVEIDENDVNIGKNFKWVALGIFLLGTIISILIASFSKFELEYRWMLYRCNNRPIDPTLLNIAVYCRDDYVMAHESIDFDHFFSVNFWENILNSIKTTFGLIGISQNGDYLSFFPFSSFTFLGSFLGETIYVKNESVFRFLHTRYDGSLTCDENKKALVKNNILLRKIYSPFVLSGVYPLIIYFTHEIVITVVGSLIILCMGVKLNL